jgi:DNA polymerase-3 subunit gamma/tau
VIRELARLTRDLLVVTVDPSRISDPEICAEGDRERVKALAAQFSSEDLMRAFEVLTKADYEIRGSAQPRYHLEMALLRWIHLRKLVPLSELIQGLERGGIAGASGKAVSRPAAPAPAPVRPALRPPASNAATVRAVEARKEAAKVVGEAKAAAPPGDSKAASTNGDAIPHVQQVGAADIKDAFLAEVRKAKKSLYGTVIAQAQRIDVERDRIVFTFAPQHRTLRTLLDQSRAQLETLAGELAGRQMAVVSVEGTAAAPPPRAGSSDAPAAPSAETDRKAELKQQALADSGVQTLLDVFGGEIRDVEEIEGK